MSSTYLVLTITSILYIYIFLDNFYFFDFWIFCLLFNKMNQNNTEYRVLIGIRYLIDTNKVIKIKVYDLQQFFFCSFGKITINVSQSISLNYTINCFSEEDVITHLILRVW